MRRITVSTICLMVLALSYAGCDIKRHPADDAIVTGVHSAVVEMNSVTDLTQTVSDSTQGFIFYGAQANEYYPPEGTCTYSDGADIGFLLSEGPGDLGRLFLGPCIKQHECCDWTTIDDFLPTNQEEIFQFEHVEQSNGLIYYSLMDEEKEYQFDTVYPMCITGGADMGLTYYPKIFRSPKNFTITEVNWVEKDLTREQDLKENYRLPEILHSLCDVFGDLFPECQECFRDACFRDWVIEELSKNRTPLDIENITINRSKRNFETYENILSHTMQPLGLEIAWNPFSEISDQFTIEMAVFKQENKIGRVHCSARDKLHSCPSVACLEKNDDLADLVLTILGINLEMHKRFVIPPDQIKNLPFTETEKPICRDDETNACIHNNCTRAECSLMGRIIIKRTSENLIEMDEGKYLLALSRLDVETGLNLVEPLDDSLEDDSWSKCPPLETPIP